MNTLGLVVAAADIKTMESEGWIVRTLLTAVCATVGLVACGIDAETKRIQGLLDDCWRKGGGTVTLEAGEHSVKGLRLRSNTTLYLKSGCVLKASRDCGDYDVLSSDALEPVGIRRRGNPSGLTGPSTRND